MIDCTWLYLCDFSSFKAAHAGKYAYAWQKCSLVRWANIDCNCNIFTGKWTRGVDYLEWTRPLDVNVVLVDTIEKALFEKAVFEMFKMTRSCHVSLIEIIVHNGGSFFIIKGSLLSITSCTITHVKTCIKKCQQTLVSLYNSLHYSLHTCHYHLFMYWIAPIESSPPPQKKKKKKNSTPILLLMTPVQTLWITDPVKASFYCIIHPPRWTG